MAKARRGGLRKPGKGKHLGRPTLFHGQKHPKTKHTVRLTSDALQAATDLADHLGESLSEAVEYSIRKTAKLPVEEA